MRKSNKQTLVASTHTAIGEAEQERARIVRLLHDGPCQTLNGLQLLLHVRARGTEADRILRTDDPLLAAVNEAVEEMHRVIEALRGHCAGND